MRPSLWILSTGTELSTGRSRDTNSGEIARRFAESGWTVKGISVLPDDPEVLISHIRWIATGMGVSDSSSQGDATDRLHAIIMTGGLGPTEDDFTIDALARLTGSEIIDDARALHRLEAFIRLKGRFQLDAARRQVRVLKDGTVIENPTGLAPGVLVSLQGKVGEGGAHAPYLAALPGVPSEMRPMLDDVLDRLRTSIQSTPCFRREFHVYDEAESQFQRVVFGDASVAPGSGSGSGSGGPSRGAPLAAPELHNDVAFHWGISAIPGAVKVFLEHETSHQGIDELAESIQRHYGERFLLAPVEELLPKLLLERGWNLSLAESCTGGLISKMLTDRPGSSAYFAGAAVTYANAAKSRLLHVDESILKEHGAVSAECARAMAEGARLEFGTTASLAITGIAGPDGGTPEKPVGTVFIAGCHEGGSFTRRLYFPLDRERVRESSARSALFHLFCFLRSQTP